MRCEFIGDELVGVTLERPSSPPLPGGTLGTYLTMLGDVEAGRAFQVFDTFMDGMPKDATREDIPLRGAILDTATDRVWEFQDVAYVHARGRAGAPLVSICVSVAPPDVLSERTR